MAFDQVGRSFRRSACNQLGKRQFKQPFVEREQPARFGLIFRLKSAKQRLVQFPAPPFGCVIARQDGLAKHPRLTGDSLTVRETV
jgi:hypothetical protein